VEHLSVPDRVKKIIEAGCDILGGETCPEIIIELVENGQLSEARLDESVRRILRDKFRLGLFDNPYVDPDAAAQMVGNSDFQAAGSAAQRKSIVLLKNGIVSDNLVLPLSGRPKLYLERINPETASAYGDVTPNLDEADWAILRLDTPYQTRDTGNFLERMFHAGDLDFKDEAKTRVLDILSQRPTIVVMHLDRRRLRTDTFIDIPLNPSSRGAQRRRTRLDRGPRHALGAGSSLRRSGPLAGSSP
jgi:beta-glucosidase